jgi:polysulfide reductase chain C
VRKQIPWIGRLSLWNRPKARNIIGWIGTGLALGVSVYTGVLLSATVTPLWRNFSLPLFFSLSALATGFAGGAILATLSVVREDPGAMKEPLQFLKRGYRVILPCLLLVALAYMTSGVLSPESRPVMVRLITGWTGLIWWVGVIGTGMAMPWALVTRRQAIQGHKAWYLFSSILVGGFLLRFVLVYAGQGSM